VRKVYDSTEVNDGGFPVKNAGYWRRRFNKLERENRALFARIKELENGKDERILDGNEKEETTI